jgi:hypothetical protein
MVKSLERLRGILLRCFRSAHNPYRESHRALYRALPMLSDDADILPSAAPFVLNRESRAACFKLVHADAIATTRPTRG